MSFNPPVPTTDKQLYLPQKHICDASVQTSDALNQYSLLVSTDAPLSTSSGCQTLDSPFDFSIHSKDITTILLSFNPLASSTNHTMPEATNQSCQTQNQDSSEFGTQTCHSLEDLLGTDFGTRTLENFGTQTIEDYTDLDLDTLLPPGCLSFGTQTSLENMADCLEFGVQTLLQTETKDQESQTLHTM